MIGMIRLFVLLCAAFAAVSASPIFAQPGSSGDSFRVCAYAASKHCTGPSVCDNVSLNKCHGLSVFHLSFSVKLTFDEQTNSITFQRFKDGDCSVPHPDYTPAPSGQLDTCIGPVAKYLKFLKIYVKISRA